MRSHGYSLVEMIIVIAMISILLAIGTLQFNDYAHRYRTEAQMGLLLSELSKARANAICQGRGTRLKLYFDRFEVYSSLVNGTGVKPQQTHRLHYPIIWGITAGKDSVDFNESGITYDWGSICLDTDAGSGAVDSIVVATTKASIGKRGEGNDCGSDFITLK